MVRSLMKALVTLGDGTFELTEILIPTPKPNELLIKVEACALNHTDWKSTILHKRPGNVVGVDFAGTVAVVGSAVLQGPRDLRVGERVAGVAQGNASSNGAFAEYLVADPALLISLPDEISFEMGAQLGVSCFASCQALYQALHLPTPLEPATSPTDILIWSGTSSTGQYAVQFAKLAGLRVLSTSSPANFEFVKSLGAEEVFDYSDSRTMKKVFAATGGNLRLAVDCISEKMTPVQISRSLSAEGGKIATVLPYESKKQGVETELVLVSSMWGKPVEVPIPMEAHPEHYQNAITYSTLISHLLAKKSLKLGPIQILPKGLSSVKDGFAYMMAGKVGGPGKRRGEYFDDFRTSKT